jgi:hypothetical protein
VSIFNIFRRNEVRRGVMPYEFLHCTLSAFHPLTEEIIDKECRGHECRECRWRIPQLADRGAVIALLKDETVRLVKKARP